MATLLDRSGRCQDDSLDTVSSPGHEHLGLWDIYRNCPSHHPQSMAALRGAMPPKKTTALRALSKRVSGPGTSQWYRLSPERVKIGFFLFPTLCQRKGRGTQNHRVPRLAAVRRTTRRLLHAPTSFGKRSLTSLEGGTRELSCSRRTCPRDSTVSFADSGTRPQNAVHKRSSSPPLRRGETGHPTSKSERHPIAQEKTLLEEQWHTCRAFRHAHNMAALWFDRALRP